MGLIQYILTQIFFLFELGELVVKCPAVLQPPSPALPFKYSPKTSSDYCLYFYEVNKNSCFIFVFFQLVVVVVVVVGGTKQIPTLSTTGWWEKKLIIIIILFSSSIFETIFDNVKVTLLTLLKSKKLFCFGHLVIL